jgi:hypothetical protein
MVSGHRPMYPEYKLRNFSFRNLYLLEHDNVYDNDGARLATLDDADNLITFVRDTRSCLFTGTLVQSFASKFLRGLLRMGQRILCNKKGKPLGVRLRCGRETRWISTCETWKEVAEPGVIERMWEHYEWMGVGFAPTPGSLGNKFMLKVYEREHLRRHTSLSRACELFIHEHANGGMAYTNGLGHYDQIQYMDMCAAYLRWFRKQPDGAAVRITDGNVTGLATYFCRCDIVVHSELALGPFPVRGMRNHKPKVFYPTLPGSYNDVYLSKERVEECRRVGCTVSVHEGFGWRDFTFDNELCSQELFRLRQTAPSKHVQEKAKVTALAPIGRHGMRREHQYLVDQEHSEPTDECILNDYGEPLDYYVHTESDDKSAYMTHWWWYTVDMCNLAVYHFALPYAMQGRLVAIDFDSIFVLEGDDKHKYVKKYSREAAACQAGDWQWLDLHNVNILGDRTFESDEMTRKPGQVKSALEERSY